MKENLAEVFSATSNEVFCISRCLISSAVIYKTRLFNIQTTKAIPCQFQSSNIMDDLNKNILNISHFSRSVIYCYKNYIIIRPLFVTVS